MNTIETTEEFIEKYGSELVVFFSYYRHSFVFKGITDKGEDIFCTVGGCADEIYKFYIEVDKKYSISELGPYSGSVINNGVGVDSFFDT